MDSKTNLSYTGRDIVLKRDMTSIDAAVKPNWSACLFTPVLLNLRARGVYGGVLSLSTLLSEIRSLGEPESHHFG